MFIVTSGTGHVGSAVAAALLEAGEPVTIVSRNPAKAKALKDRGATIASVDVHDVDGLRQVFRSGRRAFLLNPPADVASDTDVEERRTVTCLLEALDGSGLEKVVAESTMGARPGDRIGDLSVLYGFEQGLRRQAIPADIIRAGYYFSNWDAMAEPASRHGAITSMLPADLKLPMVAPEDIGRIAARLLREPPSGHDIHFVEGPERYSPRDVAAAFGVALGRDVDVKEVPRANWEDQFKALGFSPAAADAYARMTAATVDNPDYPDDPIRGSITLQAYIGNLARPRPGITS